jgi:hypothetical protein
VRRLVANGILDDATRRLIVVVLKPAGRIVVLVQEAEDHIIQADAAVRAAAQQRASADRVG